MLPRPPNGYLADAEAEKALQLFVFGGKYDPIELPKRADPAKVDEFVRQVLDIRDLKPQPLARCGMLMAFFDLRARAEQLAKWVERRELDDAPFERSMTVVNLAGDFGDVALRERAARLYEIMLTHRLAKDHFPRLIDCLFHLPPPADAKWVSEALGARLKSLQARAATDEDAAVAAGEVEDWLRDRLPSVVEARKKREEINKITAPDRRRTEMARYYLQIEVNGYIDMATWGMMMLQRECNENSPPEIAGDLSHVLDIIISRGTAMRSPTAKDEKDLAIYVTRCRHAIEFYLGRLSDKQAQFAEKHHNEKQRDVLHWDK